MTWMTIVRGSLRKNKQTNHEDYANNEKSNLVKRKKGKWENKNDYKLC